MLFTKIISNFLLSEKTFITKVYAVIVDKGRVEGG